MPMLEERERAALRQADDELSDLQVALEAAVQSNALDRESVDRLHDTAEQVAGRVNTNLPMQVDADARDEIRRRLIEMLTLSIDDGAPLDLADRALIEAEAVRHVLRDLLQEQPPAGLRDAQETVHLLENWFPGLAVNQLAELAGMSTRQFQRRRQDGGVSSHRLQMLARLGAILRYAWTDQGVYAWFHRQRLELGGRAPIDLLEDPASERDLMRLARAGRVQGGS